jgi:hypothetical protein
LAALPDINWRLYPDLLFDLFLLKAEAIGYTRGSVESDEVFSLLLRNTDSADRKAEICVAIMRIKQAQGEYKEGIDYGFLGFEYLGVKMKRYPSFLDFLFLVPSVRRQINEIFANRVPIVLPTSKSITDELLINIGILTYLFNKRLSVYFGFERFRRFSRAGISGGSLASLALCAAILESIFGRHKEAQRLANFGELASQGLAEGSDRAQVSFMLDGFIKVWSQSLSVTIENLKQNYELAKQFGNPYWARCCALYSAAYSLQSGTRLQNIDPLTVGPLEYFSRHKDAGMFDSLLIIQLTAYCLRGETTSQGSFSTGSLDEESLVERMKQYPSPNALSWYRVHRLWIDYLLLIRSDFSLANCYLSASFVRDVPFAIGRVIQYTYSVLMLCDCYDKLGVLSRLRAKWLIWKNLRRLKRTANNSPEIALASFHLAKAEFARLRGRNLEAVSGYQEGLRVAAHYNSVHLEALGYELIAKQQFAQGDQFSSARNITLCYAYYKRWGATAKAIQIRKFKIQNGLKLKSTR